MWLLPARLVRRPLLPLQACGAVVRSLLSTMSLPPRRVLKRLHRAPREADFSQRTSGPHTGGGHRHKAEEGKSCRVIPPELTGLGPRGDLSSSDADSRTPTEPACAVQGMRSSKKVGVCTLRACKRPQRAAGDTCGLHAAGRPQHWTCALHQQTEKMSLAVVCVPLTCFFPQRQ